MSSNEDGNTQATYWFADGPKCGKRIVAPTWFDPYQGSVLKAVERARLVRDTLIEMVDRGQSDHVTTLWLVYGDPPRFGPFGIFGELRSIVELTPTGQELGDRYAILDALSATGGDVVLKKIKKEAEAMLAAAGKAYEGAK